MDGRPLTPIEDIPENWNDGIVDKSEDYICYQNKRMSSLFKYVYNDGHVRYSELYRSYCKDLKTGSTYQGGGSSDIIDELFPITMPYSGVVQPYVMYTEECLTDHKNGDYDTKAYWYIIAGDGTKTEVNRFFAEEPGKKGKERWREITIEEWYIRYNASLNRVKEKLIYN